MERFTLTVPLAFNDGAPVPSETLDAIEEQLVRMGGFTATDGIGAWQGADRIYREPVRVYALDGIPEYLAGPVYRLAREVAFELDQEAVYVTRSPITAELVAPEAVTA